MSKHVAASASSLFHKVSPLAPEDASGAVSCVERILAAVDARHDNRLSEEEFELIAHCLDLIGSEEASVSEDGSLQGKGSISFDTPPAAPLLRVATDIEVKNVWDRTRHEWACTMGLQKLAGCPDAEKACFTFHFASFGASDQGEPVVLFDFSYERTMDAPSQIRNFNKGAALKASEYDITSNVQWGYLIVAHCRIFLADGTVISV